LAGGKLLIPRSSGSVNMMYSSVQNPGASMVAHPILPGRLNRDVTDVLPCGYQSVSHCARVTFHLVSGLAPESRNQWGPTRGNSFQTSTRRSQCSRDGGSHP
jgi:hypothetical protein